MSPKNGFQKQNIFWLLDKLWPKIWELDLFEMVFFYYYLVKGKLAKNSHFYILRVLYLIKPNFEFGTTLILWLPENEP